MEDVRYPQDIESRRAQVVPTLNPAQIEVARRFGGEPERFAPGEVMIPLDGRNRCFIILEGSIDLIRRDGLGNESRIVVFEPGQFSGETNLLSNRTAIGEGRAGASGCLAIPFTAPEVRGLIIGHAEIGEIVMRAFILRRVALLAAGAATTVIVGPATNHDVLRLQSFFARHGYPNTLLEPNVDDTAQSIAARFGVQEHDLPIVVCQDGTLLRNPSDTEVAWRVGITSELATNTLFDVAVIGAGPAGLATAVYAASEGLSVLILESRVFGGQAGASARIENYLGFPTGISGQALMGRAFHQAAKFGADVVMPMAVTRLRCNRPTRSLATAAEIEVSTGATVRARTAAIATGARYKRPEIARLDECAG